MLAIFSLLFRALSLLKFIVTCLILYLDKSHNTRLSLTASNPSIQSGTLSFISSTKFSLSRRLV